MTPRRLLGLITDSYWLHEWLIPLTFIAVAITALTFIIVAVVLFLNMKREMRRGDKAQAARLDAVLKDRELNYP